MALVYYRYEAQTMALLVFGCAGLRMAPAAPKTQSRFPLGFCLVNKTREESGRALQYPGTVVLISLDRMKHYLPADVGKNHGAGQVRLLPTDQCTRGPVTLVMLINQGMSSFREGRSPGGKLQDRRQSQKSHRFGTKLCFTVPMNQGDRMHWSLFQKYFPELETSYPPSATSA